MTPTGEIHIPLSTTKAPLYSKKHLWDDSYGNMPEQELKNSLKSMKEKATLIAEQSGPKGKSLRKGNGTKKTKGDTTENEDSDDDLFVKKETSTLGGKDELSSHNKDQNQKLALQKQITPSSDNKHGQLNLLAETSSVQIPIILKNDYMEVLTNRKFTKDERNCIKRWMEETPNEDMSTIMSEKNGDIVYKSDLQTLK